MKANQYIAMAIMAAALCGCGQKEEYRLVWEDNFEGTELNAAYWNADDNARGGGNAEMQYYTPRNISIERHPVSGESCLVLSARREDYGNRPATSARLNTQD
ncbi:MAG: hypothetical protein ACI4BD_04520, partial [Paludibacteraceae bacterium]